MLRIALAAAGILLAAAGGSDLGPVEAPEVPWSASDPACSPKLSPLDCHLNVAEREFFRRFAGTARRVDPKTVAVRLRDGSEATIGNRNDCRVQDEFYTESACATATPIFYFDKRGYFLFETSFYEGGGFLLVSDRDGSQTQLSATPHFSPDGSSFTVVSGPTVAQDGSNAVEVWDLRGGTPALDFRYEPPDSLWGYWFIGWDGPNRIALSYRTWLDGHEERPAHAIRTASGWSIVEDQAN